MLHHIMLYHTLKKRYINEALWCVFIHCLFSKLVEFTRHLNVMHTQNTVSVLT